MKKRTHKLKNNGKIINARKRARKRARKQKKKKRKKKKGEGERKNKEHAILENERLKQESFTRHLP